mmetsp:Transcript_29756/g.69231  ORF Transcript_29756/g.69231 Transcript_29756/m.69231 type:complete len:277 (-) Transcript_29756:909-1739(-)
MSKYWKGVSCSKWPLSMESVWRSAATQRHHQLRRSSRTTPRQLAPSLWLGGPELSAESASPRKGWRLISTACRVCHDPKGLCPSLHSWSASQASTSLPPQHQWPVHPCCPSSIPLSRSLERRSCSTATSARRSPLRHSGQPRIDLMRIGTVALPLWGEACCCALREHSCSQVLEMAARSMRTGQATSSRSSQMKWDCSMAFHRIRPSWIFVAVLELGPRCCWQILRSASADLASHCGLTQVLPRIGMQKTRISGIQTCSKGVTGLLSGVLMAVGTS